MSDRATRYAVYGPDDDEPLIIDAENWVFALGTALELMEREDWVSRLSCEVHPDGTVVAEDRVTQARYLVHRVPYAATRPDLTPDVQAQVALAVDDSTPEPRDPTPNAL
ncbi:MAG: hypothetical protein AB8H79_09440 [Myxococcota bacterium]